MRKVVDFDSPRLSYDASVAIVWCFDHRFAPILSTLARHLSLVHYDLICVAGGAKSLASNETGSDGHFVLDQIRASMRLHGANTVILMLHSDCGAYGGLDAFDDAANREAEHHREELQRAAETVKREIPGLAVKTYFVDFEGVWDAGVERGPAA